MLARQRMQPTDPRILLPDSHPFQLHRLALQPFLPHGDNHWRSALRQWLEGHGEDPFVEFLGRQGLAPAWHELIADNTEDPLISSQSRQVLRQEAIRAAQIYMAQKKALVEIGEILDRENLPHLFFKGSHLREIFGSRPATRTACDLDLLVDPGDRVAAMRALVAAGYRLEISATSVSHEASLTRGLVTVDIHWDILRPGRTRQPMTPALLKARKRYGDHWGPTPEHSLFLMLVHPVITKYATSPLSTINRLVDLLLGLESADVDWRTLEAILADSGLKTAAWIMLEWLRLTTGMEYPRLQGALAPGLLRRRYLNRWLMADLSTRLGHHHNLIRVGFTLPAHDRASDALRATLFGIKARIQAARDMATVGEAVGNRRMG